MTPEQPKGTLLKRNRLFEFNDADWSPEFLREVIVEGLSLTLRWGRMLQGVVGPFREFLRSTQASEVLDLCAGAGGPATSLIEEFRRQGVSPPKFILTDLHPVESEWVLLRQRYEGAIDFVGESVDAREIPEGLSTGRIRTIMNAFHHLEAEQARAVLLDAVHKSQGIFVVEPFFGGATGILPFAPVAVFAILAAPWLTSRHQVAKLAVTYLTPFIIAAVSIWDGIVSTRRVYQRAELFKMVEGTDQQFVWEWGIHRNRWGMRGYYFSGRPRKSSDPPANLG